MREMEVVELNSQQLAGVEMLLAGGHHSLLQVSAHSHLQYIYVRGKLCCSPSHRTLTLESAFSHDTVFLKGDLSPLARGGKGDRNTMVELKWGVQQPL
jgi:hypothetical protein